MKPRKGKRKQSESARIVELALDTLSDTDATDGDLVLVLAQSASDGSTALGSWPNYQDHNKRVRALLEMAFKRSCYADGGES